MVSRQGPLVLMRIHLQNSSAASATLRDGLLHRGFHCLDLLNKFEAGANNLTLTSPRFIILLTICKFSHCVIVLQHVLCAQCDCFNFFVILLVLQVDI